jgi:hypothetical protein
MHINIMQYFQATRNPKMTLRSRVVFAKSCRRCGSRVVSRSASSLGRCLLQHGAQRLRSATRTKENMGLITLSYRGVGSTKRPSAIVSCQGTRAIRVGTAHSPMFTRSTMILSYRELPYPILPSFPLQLLGKKGSRRAGTPSRTISQHITFVATANAIG